MGGSGVLKSIPATDRQPINWPEWSSEIARDEQRQLTYIHMYSFDKMYVHACVLK